MFRGFFNDPFFDVTGSSMNRIFGDDLGMLDAPSHSSRHSRERSRHEGALSLFGGLDPFSSFERAFSDMNSLMTQNLMDPSNMMDNGTGFGFSSSSVQSYVDDGSGKPQVYEARKSAKYAPGGIRQEERTLRDSRAGIERMSVGRHLGERGHVITKSRNQPTKQIEEDRNYIGFAEEEEPIFDSDWKKATRQFMQPSIEQLYLPQRSSKRKNKLRDKYLKPKTPELDQA